MLIKFILELFFGEYQIFFNFDNLRLQEHTRFNWIYSLTDYKKYEIKNAIWKIKYLGNKKLVNDFGKVLATEIKHAFKNNGKIILIPVPIHFRRRLERGFNQSERICQVIKKYNPEIIIRKKVFSRKKYSRKQSWSNKEVRGKNVDSVFKINLDELKKINHEFKSFKIIIIDDVVTTGATLNSLRNLFPEKFLKKMIAVVLAK